MDRKIPLPRGWKRRVRSSVLHIPALSHYTLTVLVARAANERTLRCLHDCSPARRFAGRYQVGSVSQPGNGS